MTWNVSGRGIEICSCKTFCPCWLTPDVEPDEGWCSAVLAWDAKEGTCDGVDFAGVKFAIVADWPGNFHGGGGKARLYVDNGVSVEQQNALRAIFEGKKDGALPALWGAVIDEWVTPCVADISIDWDRKTAAIANVGKAEMKSLTDADGKQAHMYNSVSQVAMGIDRLDLMAVKGPAWSDPDLRDWKASDAVKFDLTLQ